jgi:hypothetical protein
VTEPSRSFIAICDRSGGCDCLGASVAGDVAEEVVKDEGSVAAVKMAGRAFIGGTEFDFHVSSVIAVSLDHQRRRERIA